MHYPLDPDQVAQGVSRLIAADPLTNGQVPGFQIVERTDGSSIRVGTRDELKVVLDSATVSSYDDIDDLLVANSAEKFVAETGIRMLSGAQPMTHEQATVMVPRWDYHMLMEELGPARAVIFPHWRSASASLPDVPDNRTVFLGSLAVPFDQVIWVAGGDGQFYRNDAAHLRFEGSSSTITIPIDVWRIGKPGPAYARIILNETTIVVPPRY